MKKVHEKIDNYLNEDKSSQARAEMKIVFENIRHIMIDAVMDADAALQDFVNDKLERKIFVPAIKKIIKELDSAGDAAEGNWQIQTSSVDKIFADYHKEVVKQFGAGSPVVDAYWNAVEELWFER
jgi:soluble cytochrome b562